MVAVLAGSRSVAAPFDRMVGRVGEISRANSADVDDLLRQMPWLSARAELTAIIVMRGPDRLFTDLHRVCTDRRYRCCIILTGGRPIGGYGDLLTRSDALYDLPALLPRDRYTEFLRSLAQHGRRNVVIDIASGVVQPDLSDDAVGAARSEFMIVVRTAPDCAGVGPPGRVPQLVALVDERLRSLVESASSKPSVSLPG